MSIEWTIFLLLLSVVIVGAIVWSIQRRKSTSLPSASLSSARAAAELAPQVEALVLGPVENPLMEIYPAPDDSSLVQIDASPAMKMALAPILQRAPDMLSVGGQMASKGYRVVFSPEVTRALREGTAELLPSADALLPVARDASKGKKFVEIGRVAKEGGIKLASIATMSWQFLSIITAQHYLNEINARLAGIENGINDIRAWLEEDKKSQLRSDLLYLREVSSALSRGHLHAHEIRAFYNHLDDIERRANAIGELARQMSIRRLDDLQRLDVRHWMDRSGSAGKAREWIQHNKEIIDLILLAQAVRMLGCQVKSLLPGDQQRLKERLAQAREEVENARTLFESTREVFLSKVSELRRRDDSILALGGIFDADHRRELENEFAIVREAIAQAADRFATESHSAIEMAQQLDSLGEAGMELELRLDDKGEIQIYSPKNHVA